MTGIYTAQVCELKELNNLFIELTAKNCNLRCKHCYIDFPFSKKVKDFISVDLIKRALNDTTRENIECIYLTGAEPMTHPDFNTILRLCLKRSNVCICTNASFINEKKARFLKKVEEESDYEIIFMLSLDHYNEVKNDDIRGRGTYRQVLHAVRHLIKYNFNPILCVTDFYNEGETVLIQELKKVFTKIGFIPQNKNFKVNMCVKNIPADTFENSDWKSLDCEYGRILTSKGVYNCPFLANDHRGRSGSNFSDFSRKNSLETTPCSYCLKNGKSYFGINYKDFN